METQSQCYNLKTKLVSGRQFLAQDISSVVGNTGEEGVDASLRSHLLSKELEFPSHSAVKARFCSRVLAWHHTHTHLTSCLRVEKGPKPPCAICFKISSLWVQKIISVIHTYKTKKGKMQKVSLVNRESREAWEFV